MIIYKRSKYNMYFIDHNYYKILNCKIYFTNYFNKNIYNQANYIIKLLYIKHYK